MADRTLILKEPTAAHVSSISVVCDTDGAVSSVHVNYTLESDDESVQLPGTAKIGPEEYPQDMQDMLGRIISKSASLVAAAKGF